jgi:hypothetical protein
VKSWVLSSRPFRLFPAFPHKLVNLGFEVYAKVFSQIFDSSIADDYALRHFFMDMLVLADPNGVVDMTPTAISARTRIPLDIVKKHLAELESPDSESRTPEHDGRRLAKLDNHRSWGWVIINYDKFRKIATEHQRREKTAERTRNYRKRKACDAPVTLGDASVTPLYASPSPYPSALKAPERNFPEIEVPSWVEVKDQAAKIGLVEWKALDWFEKMKSTGWPTNVAKTGKQRRTAQNSNGPKNDHPS